MKPLFRAIRNPWSFIILATLVLIAGYCVAYQAEAKPPPSMTNTAASIDGLHTGTWYYGVYLNNKKTGWMQNSIQHQGKKVIFTSHLHAKIGGLGQIKTLNLDEKRTYNKQTNHLESIVFSQSTPGAHLEVNAFASGKKLTVQIHSGGKTTTKHLPNSETLDDALAIQHLARSGHMNRTLNSTRFDPATLSIIHMTYQLRKIQRRRLNGVMTRMVQINTHYKELQVDETSWFNLHGMLLESRVGGFFVARLEPHEVAKRLDYSHDILKSALVPLPQPIEHPEKIKRLHLVMSGFDQTHPPASSRQQVSTGKGTTILDLRKNTFPAHLSWKTLRQETQRNTKLKPFLKSTPFIQSSDPALIAAAKRAVGNTPNVNVAIKRLTQFVYNYVQDDYIPAFSNALEVLHTKKGDCTEHAVLFVALARALGIPSRVAVGIAYWPAGKGFGWHAWSEVFLGKHWISVDPTWNQEVADVTHIKLAGGSVQEQARIVMLLGKLKVLNVKHQ